MAGHIINNDVTLAEGWVSEIREKWNGIKNNDISKISMTNLTEVTNDNEADLEHIEEKKEYKRLIEMDCTHIVTAAEKYMELDESLKLH